MAKTKLEPTSAELSDALTRSSAPQPGVAVRNMLSTGSTLLNLSLTGRRQGGWVKGTFSHVVGDSNSGKTWFAMTALAEASLSPQFDDYHFIYNAPEGGAIMDRSFFFGKRAADRIEEIRSATVQDLYRDIKARQAKGEPMIYILDSESALSSKQREKEFEKEAAADEDGEETKGSYRMDKPRYHSDHLSEVVNALADTGSIMIWISQTRDNIGFGSKFKPKTYSGGHALKFYATYQIWVAIRGQLKQHYKGKDRQQGIIAQLHVKKNRVTGRDRMVEVPIYHSLGVDDVGSCVDWLVDESRWKVGKKKGEEGLILADDLNLRLSRDDLVAAIEAQNLEKQMQIAVAERWQEIEDAVKVDRKARYV